MSTMAATTPLRRAIAQKSHLMLRRSLSSSTAFRKEIQDAYIIAAARTPVVPFNGAYVSVPASQLGAYAIKEAVSRSHVDPSRITSVFMGNVLSANAGQAPARQATILSGLSPTVEATTINKVCSSGLKAVALASQQVQLGLEEVVVAGGMENMSRVPYYVPRASQMPPFGQVTMVDGMIADGLWDFYNNIHMGNCAENTAKKYNISREAQDAYAIETYRRAGEAVKSGAFQEEIVPVTIKGKKGDTIIEADQGYDRIKLDKVPTLRPAFQKDGGTVTAANSSSFNDGASAVIVTSAAVAKEQASQSRVLARIVSTADAAVEPIDFPVAPAKAVPIALERAGLKVEDIAHWEINEAFAAVVVANMQILGLEGDKALAKVNPLGGAIPLGHAIGSSGSRILTTMLHRLKPGEFGCAAICNGGGAASAMIVQRVDTV